MYEQEIDHELTLLLQCDGTPSFSLAIALKAASHYKNKYLTVNMSRNNAKLKRREILQ